MYEKQLMIYWNFVLRDPSMDKLNQKYTDPDVDLESGGTTSEEERAEDASPPNSQKKKDLKRVLGGVLRFDGSSKGESCVDFCSNSFRHGKDVECSLTENKKENVPFLDKVYVQEKRPLTNSRKHPKPPRPPKGPLLDGADQKLVRDTAEVAVRKRMMVERMKALKKAKAAALSRSFSTSSVAAMLITVLFLLIIIFQGVSSRNDPRLLDSLKSDDPISESLISVHHLDSLPSDRRSISGSRASNSPCVEKSCVSGSGSKDAASRVAD